MNSARIAQLEGGPTYRRDDVGQDATNHFHRSVSHHSAIHDPARVCFITSHMQPYRAMIVPIEFGW
jgi:hypothetical protein